VLSATRLNEIMGCSLLLCWRSNMIASLCVRSWCFVGAGMYVAVSALQRFLRKFLVLVVS
jgi:hypothetical protein